jgi:predicted CoA-binding protein
MTLPTKKTMVLGASTNPERYSYLAVRRLRGAGHPVAAIGRTTATVGDVDITTDKAAIPDVDTVTLYLNPANQKEYYDYILSLHPRRIIFNPGAENPELQALASANGIEPVEACTLVLLSTGQY